MTKIFHNSINLDCFSWESIVGIKKSYFGRTLTIVFLSNALIQNIISTKMEVDNTEQNICIFVFQFIIFFQKKNVYLSICWHTGLGFGSKATPILPYVDWCGAHMFWWTDQSSLWGCIRSGEDYKKMVVDNEQRLQSLL